MGLTRPPATTFDQATPIRRPDGDLTEAEPRSEGRLWA